jgi:CHAP domain
MIPFMVETIGMSEFIDKVLDIAAGEVGVRETAPNRGPRVDEYHIYAGRDPALADSWCAQFIWWVLGHAADYEGTAGLRFSSSGARLWELNQDKIADGDPQPGDVGIADHGEGKSHVWLWVSCPGPDGRAQTIEGNSNIDGSRNGIMVCRHARLPAEATFGTLRPAPTNADPVA